MRRAWTSLRAGAAAALVSAVACDGGGAGGLASDDGCGPASGRVAQVIDGDTIQLESGERVRYLMVDTPESTTDVECYGPEAARFNAELVEGTDVELTYDEECADDYQRLLAYVAVREREINALLVERGFGCALYIPPNGEDRRDEFESLQSQARAADRGLWGACPENPCN
jgi:micrococcal nuclease